MSRISEIEQEMMTTGTIVDLASVFEGVASMRIARIKNQVLHSTEFFNDLWNIYTQLRVDSLFRYGRGDENDPSISKKELFIIVTAEGGFSGDIDQKLINLMLESHDPEKSDIIVIGHHGAIQLAMKGISYEKYFRMPQVDQNINVGPIIKHVQRYRRTFMYYQHYASLTAQNARRIELGKAVAEIGHKVEEGDEIISESNYIFEPSNFAVIDHIERSMLQIAISQLILESKLAQFASRFRAMSVSHEVADESLGDAKLRFNRAKRLVKDERLKEVVNGIKKAKLQGGGQF